MKQSRFLLFMLIGVALLDLITVGIFVARYIDQLTYSGDETTPSGVLSNFIQAACHKEYNKAYNYLVDAPYKPTLDEFRNRYQNLFYHYGNVCPAMEISIESIEQETAYLSFSLIKQDGGPLNYNDGSIENAQLIQQNGHWKIKQMPYPYWEYYQWYNPPVKP